MRFGNREIIFLLLLAVTPVAAYFYVFEPRNEQIAAARAEIARKQDKLRKLEAATMDIADLGAEIDKLTQAVAMFEQKLPAEREVEVVLREVWQLASKHELTPRSVRTDKPVAAAQYSELPIRMTIVGNFDGFYAFLLELENLPRITRMPKMELKKLADDDHEGRMQADVVLTVFFESGKGSTSPVLSRGRS